MSDVIISADKSRPLDFNILNQTGSYGDVSSKYIATPTQDVLNLINEFEPCDIVSFNRANVRDEEKHGFQKHAIMIKPKNNFEIDGTSFMFTIFNSNDRSSSIKIYGGLHRWICSNEMQLGNDIVETIKIRHTKKDWQYSIYKLMQQYDDIKKQTADMIERMMKSRSSHGDASRFNHAVAEMLNSDLTGTILDPMQLGNAHRLEDVGMSQWLIYQRAQSNVINGGVDRIIERVDEETGSIKKLISKTHKVTDQQKIIDYNIKLNNLALELL